MYRTTGRVNVGKNVKLTGLTEEEQTRRSEKIGPVGTCSGSNQPSSGWGRWGLGGGEVGPLVQSPPINALTPVRQIIPSLSRW
jgi:hypothetical protein